MDNLMPVELWVHEIFPKLALDELLCLAATCQFFRQLITIYAIPKYLPLYVNMRVWSSEFGVIWFAVHVTKHPILSEIHVQFRKTDLLFSLNTFPNARLTKLVIAAAVEHIVPTVHICHADIYTTYKQLQQANMHSYLKLFKSVDGELVSTTLTNLHGQLTNMNIFY